MKTSKVNHCNLISQTAKKNYEKIFDEQLKKRIANIYEFCKDNINKLGLMLRGSVYPHKYIDDWEKFNETLTPGMKEFHSNLNMEYITIAD